MGEQLMYPPARGHRLEKPRSAAPTRRRRPSLWDVKEPQYGVPMPPAGARTAGGATGSSYAGATGGAGWALRAPHPRAAGAGGAAAGTGTAPAARGPPLPAVRAPAPGETGPLAGIDVAALRALLRGGGAGGAGGAGGVGAAGGVGVGVGAGGAAQLTRHARRLYVGNLPADTSEAQVADFFNRALVSAGGAETAAPPVVSVYINLEKRFAFIETRTVGEAAAALMLDGLLFGGMSLRMRRPNDFSAAAGAGARAPPGFDPSVLGIVSTQVADGPNKVFIGGIPYHLSEDQIKDLLQTYGPLAAFNLIKEPHTGLSKGFAFFEYADPSVMEAACEGLNGMQVDDKTLSVRKASTHAEAFSNGAGAGGVPGTRAVAPMSLAPAGLLNTATRVLELRNVVTDEELADDEEFKDLFEEMEEEGRNFGKLLEVVIPRPKGQGGAGGKDADALGVGRVFLRYSEIAECERAFATMSGRKFDQRTVVAKYFPEDKFDRREF